MNILMKLFFNLSTIVAFLCASCESVVHGKPRSHNRPKRVQGGTQATPHSNPWLGQLYNKEEFVGNVFLVSRPPYHHSNIEHGSSDIVITNAHYFYIGMNLSDFKLSFGKQILGRLEENQIDVQLKRVFSHHKFRHYDHDNFNQRTAAEERTMYDIAMLKLDQQVHFTKFIKPIALANSSSLANCSFTGWEKQKLEGDYNRYLERLFESILYSDGEEEEHLNEHEFYERKMFTVDMFNASSWKNILKVRMPRGKQLTKGDAGAPLICNVGGKPYARGISAAARISTELLTDIFHHMPWIIKAYQAIDREQPFHVELDQYSGKKPTSRFIITKHLEYALKGATGVVPESFVNYLQTFNLKKFTSTELWHNRLMQSTVRIWRDRFCTHEILGYVELDNVYECVTLCFSNNTKGVCNYLPSLHACYFAGYGYGYRDCVEMPSLQSVAIYSDDAKVDHLAVLWGTVKRPVNATSTSSPKKPWRQYEWNVSISMLDWPSFHCLGNLTSKKKRSEYSIVTYSTECVKRLMLNASNARMINIQAILGSRVVQTKIVDEGACHEDLMAFRSCPISKLAKPNGYPRILGHPDKKMDKPKLKRYSPSSGAFMSEPFTLPWITYFKTNTNDTCIGILFSMYDLTGDGTRDSTSFLLTTATCAKNINTTADVYTSSYFMKSINPYQKNYRIEKISIHPNFPMNAQNVHNTKTPIDFNIAIIRLTKNVIFDKFVGSVQLHSNQLLPASNLVVAAWNIEGGDHYGSLYEIPVKIVHSKTSRGDAGQVVKTFTTERLYYKGNGNLGKEVNAKPLIAYKKSGEAILIGLHVGSESREKKYLERHVALKPHIPWIEEQLKNSILYSTPTPETKVERLLLEEKK